MNDPFPGLVPSRRQERLSAEENITICPHCWGTGSIPLQGRDIPVKFTSRGYAQYPLRTMNVRERFFVPNRGRTTEQTQNAINGSIGYVQRASEKRFTQRRYANGVRVWRIR